MRLYLFMDNTVHAYIYIYMCVCVCVCVEREREIVSEREREYVYMLIHIYDLVYPDTFIETPKSFIFLEIILPLTKESLIKNSLINM